MSGDQLANQRLVDLDTTVCEGRESGLIVRSLEVRGWGELRVDM